MLSKANELLKKSHIWFSCNNCNNSKMHKLAWGMSNLSFDNTHKHFKFVTDVFLCQRRETIISSWIPSTLYGRTKTSKSDCPFRKIDLRFLKIINAPVTNGKRCYKIYLLNWQHHWRVRFICSNGVCVCGFWLFLCISCGIVLNYALLFFPPPGPKSRNQPAKRWHTKCAMQ